MFASRVTTGRRLALALVAVGLAAAAGCGGGEGLHKVKGTVSYDGQPVAEGRILFRNTGGDGRAYSAPVVNGAYEVMCEPGSMRVEITATRPVPGKFTKGANGEPDPIPLTEMYIPAKYNTATTLTAEVTDSSAEIPFTLTK